MKPGNSQTVELRGAAVTLSVSATAAMIVDAAFFVEGRAVHPMARAPWIGEPDLETVPGHLRVLGADFVAVPFGPVPAPVDLIEQWQGIIPPDGILDPHGPAGNDDWEVMEIGDDTILLGLEYPKDEAILRLERRITVRENQAAVDCELIIHARREANIPIGLHPIFRLPDRPGALWIEADFSRGWTYPGRLWPGEGPTRPGATFENLAAVPTRSGTIDLSRLPLTEPVEEIVLLTGMRGPIEAHFVDEDVTVTFDWDRNILPSIQLWISDRVLQEHPWRGRYRGLGVEAVASAFDFGTSVSAGPNPLSDAGVVTSVEIKPLHPLRIWSSLVVG